MAASKHSGRNFDQIACRNKVCDYYQAIRAVSQSTKRKMVPRVGAVVGWFRGEGGTSRAQKPHVGRALISFWCRRSVVVGSQNGKLNMKYTANIISSQGSHCTR